MPPSTPLCSGFGDSDCKGAALSTAAEGERSRRMLVPGEGETSLFAAGACTEPSTWTDCEDEREAGSDWRLEKGWYTDATVEGLLDLKAAEEPMDDDELTHATEGAAWSTGAVLGGVNDRLLGPAAL